MEKTGQRLYAAAQVRELDRRAIASGIAGYALMQRAARAAWDLLRARWPGAGHIAVVCGPGNNGGDGFELARLAHAARRTVSVFLVGDAPAQGDAVQAHAAWAKTGAIEVLDPARLAQADVVVDALFGIGLSREPQGAPLDAIRAINDARRAGVPVLALDVPSGLDADRGIALRDAVRADVTVTFIGRKAGLHTGAGPEHAGEVVLAELDLPESLHEGVDSAGHLLQAHDLAALLPRRPRTAHKGSSGHVLIVGGDEGTAGAALLAAQGALRAGAGLVTLATRAAHAIALTAAQPEVMGRGVESAAGLGPLIERADAIAIGPGLGQSAWARGLLARVLESNLPLVLDADALNLLAQDPARRDNWILTPHPGEAARLLGRSTAQVQAGRLDAVRELQARYGGVAVLKGAGSLVQGEFLALCAHGNPGMAVGGMGDVLTGVVGAFVAQGLDPESAARAGVLAHALAGDRAAQDGERGLLPQDVIAALRAVVNP